MLRKLPPLIRLWQNYPDEHDPAAVKKAIGGEVDATWITNTCTVRLSHALNYSDAPVPRAFPGLLTVAGADKKRYALRVREMAKYIEATYGPASLVAKGGAEGQLACASKKGIIMFDTAGQWSDATGHFDIWNNGIRLHAYFNEAKTVKLWFCD